VGVDAVPHHQPPARAAGDPGEAEAFRHSVGGIVRGAAARPDAVVEGEQGARVPGAPQQAIRHEAEVVLALRHAGVQEELPAPLVHPSGLPRAVLRRRAAEPLRQVRMAAGPVERPRQQRSAAFAQPPRQRRRLLGREVPQLDAGADIERSDPGVRHQLRGRGHAQQAEGQALQLRLLRPLLVQLAQGREELVGVERGASAPRRSRRRRSPGARPLRAAPPPAGRQ